MFQKKLLLEKYKIEMILKKTTKYLMIKFMGKMKKQYGQVFISILLIIFTIGLFTSCNNCNHSNDTCDIDSVVYKSEAYSVYSHSVTDSIYGGVEQPAIIPNDTTIISPVRIIPTN